MVRLAVVGVGRIGGEVAFLATALGLVDELVLSDQSGRLIRAQVLDIRHTGFSGHHHYRYPRYPGRRYLRLCGRAVPGHPR